MPKLHWNWQKFDGLSLNINKSPICEIPIDEFSVTRTLPPISLVIKRMIEMVKEFTSVYFDTRYIRW
jgi:hypothetical protein